MQRALGIVFVALLVAACAGGATTSASPRSAAPVASPAASPAAASGSATASASIATSSTACIVAIAGLKDVLTLSTALVAAAATKDAGKIKTAADGLEARADKILADLPPDHTQNMLIGSFADKLKAIVAAKPTTYDETQIAALVALTASIAAIAQDTREVCGLNY